MVFKPLVVILHPRADGGFIVFEALLMAPLVAVLVQWLMNHAAAPFLVRSIVAACTTVILVRVYARAATERIRR